MQIYRDAVRTRQSLIERLRRMGASSARMLKGKKDESITLAEERDTMKEFDH